MEERSVALDGPAGAGKSTLAKRAAERFSLKYVDTGALYRCIGLYAWRLGADPEKPTEIAQMLAGIEVDVKYRDNGEHQILLNREDVTTEIRLPAVSRYTAGVSAIPAVREYFLSKQRELAARYDVIMDGRDIGTIVMPRAGIKVFLTAAPISRARRRYIELIRKGHETTLEEVLKEIELRDKLDTTRKTAPLKPAEDADILDTTDMDLEESFEALCGIIKQRYAL